MCSNSSKGKEDFLGNELECDCLGCAIVSGKVKIPGGIIYEGEYAVLGNDPEIPILGFLIVTLKRHINSFSELNKSERNEIGNIIECAERALKALDITQEFTLVQEERSKHFHIWIFPRHSWMSYRFGTGIEYLREICNYAEKSATKEAKSEVINSSKRIKKYFEQHYINE